MKISVYTLAQAIKVPRSRVNDIVLGRSGHYRHRTSPCPLFRDDNRSSGSICRLATTWTWLTGRFADELNEK